MLRFQQGINLATFAWQFLLLIALSEYLIPQDEPTCPNGSCDNNKTGISTPKAYYSFGRTKSGSQRYRCRLCNTTFAISNRATLRQRMPEVNEMVFKLLVNKMPLKRICETAGINIGTLYRKIDFIHKQCLEFAASFEQKLPGMKIPRVYLSVDRQEYTINWGNAGDKRNTVLMALGCADNKTSYVFGIHVNHDARLDAKKVEADAKQIEEQPGYENGQVANIADVLQALNLVSLSEFFETPDDILNK